MAIILVLQHSSNSLHTVPGSSSDTHATSDGVCNVSSTEVEEHVGVIEKIFIATHEGVDIGIKQEEIPGDTTFPDIKSEPDEVSYVCVCVWVCVCVCGVCVCLCLLLDAFCVSRNLSIFMMSVFLAN